MTRILVTGSAGFIGYHTARQLCVADEEVSGLDNLNAYYDVTLKQARLRELSGFRNYRHFTVDLTDRTAMAALFEERRPQRVIHLAAQAGVRYSLDHPEAYVDGNVTGFLSILEGCRHNGVEHLVFASTSSVYGANQGLPFSVLHPTEHPLTIYAATKKANELMAHSYAHLFGIPSTALRFFTVYGPWGRPDMALFKFTQAILSGEPIQVFGNGRMQRDFTYIDDIVSGILSASDRPPQIDPSWNAHKPNPSTSGVAPYRVFNLGNSRRIELMRYIELLEQKLGRKARIELLPMQAGEVPATEADVTDTTRALGYAPSTPVEIGIARFVDWYLQFYASVRKV